ncbi:hypothetical protein RchiOBHm_Chr1g0375801 [Rosa chinensis]|uniref:Uncharacterized protein n=1 Tax=Rosa chinensis TaxID=74649 RepID=A0A2P6SMM5_ROSCH|nr:hypothetical protein RchiOBHm_Chr1g0375801 [Rosa chinensis]
MNCGRCSNEKKRTVTVAERRFHRFPAIPATSGPHFAIEGSVFITDHFPYGLVSRFSV